LSTSIGLLLIRVLAGFAMVYDHGYAKFQVIVNGGTDKFINFLGMGPHASMALSMTAEFFFAMFVVFGLFTRFSTIFLIINMAVAFFVAHAGDPFIERELSFLYMIIFLMLFFTGGGKYSLSTFIKPHIPENNQLLQYLAE